jgi:hypothetical protein
MRAAGEAIQDSLAEESWIASSLRLLEMTGRASGDPTDRALSAS